MPDPAEASSNWPELPTARRTILVVDMVESVRLMQAHEADVISRWRRLVGDVRAQVLPVHGGRLVKSLGDGLLLEFEAAPAAVAAAFAIQACVEPVNQARAPAAWIRLRMGIHVADVVRDDLDIYGSGVNLAQRLMTLAQPDEAVVSPEVIDQLVPGLDADVEDLGLCYFKNVDSPLHAFRLRHPHAGHGGHTLSASAAVPVSALATESVWAARIAVIPFFGEGVTELEAALGDAMADAVIARLSASAHMRVISRLSTAAVRARTSRVAEIGQLLGAAYVLSGSFRLQGDKIVLRTELSDARNETAVWVDRHLWPLAELMSPESPLAESLARQIADAVAAGELRRVRCLPLPTLEGFSLMLGACALMHRSSRRDFDRAGEMLEHLIERYPRAPEPRAWLAKWYVLRVSRGFVQDLQAESARALDLTHRALDASPDCSMALAAEGFVHCHMMRDLDRADECLDQALLVNPNDALAWIFRCAVQSFRGEGELAIAAGEQAICLSPLDPLRHYFDALSSTAALASHRLPRCMDLAQRALKFNRNHLPTLRTLAIAQAESGLGDAARLTVGRIMDIEPGFTISQYLERGPRGGEGPRQRYARALQSAGVPAN